MEIKREDVLQSGWEFRADLQVEVGTEAYRYLQKLYLEGVAVDGLLNDWGFSGRAAVVGHELMADADKMSCWFSVKSVT